VTKINLTHPVTEQREHLFTALHVGGFIVERGMIPLVIAIVASKDNDGTLTANSHQLSGDN
jgi:hypothetical protein